MNRIEKLAQHFQQAHQEIVALVLACPEKSWTAFCEGENETFAALVNHIALGYPLEVDLLRFTLEGAACPAVYLSQENLDQFHANSSDLYRDPDRAETLYLLRQNGVAACEFIRGISEDDLEKPVCTPLLLRWYGSAPSVERVIHDFLIGHHAMHIGNLRLAVSGSSIV